MIENAIIEEIYSDGKLLGYKVYPESGYVVHTIHLDDTDEYAKVLPGFTPSVIIVNANYNFDKKSNGVYTYTNDEGQDTSISVTKIGDFDLYALPKDIVSEQQIW